MKLRPLMIFSLTLLMGMTSSFATELNCKNSKSILKKDKNIYEITVSASEGGDRISFKVNGKVTLSSLGKKMSLAEVNKSLEGVIKGSDNGVYGIELTNLKTSVTTFFARVDTFTRTGTVRFDEKLIDLKCTISENIEDEVEEKVEEKKE